MFEPLSQRSIKSLESIHNYMPHTMINIFCFALENEKFNFVKFIAENYIEDIPEKFRNDVIIYGKISKELIALVGVTNIFERAIAEAEIKYLIGCLSTKRSVPTYTCIIADAAKLRVIQF